MWFGTCAEEAEITLEFHWTIPRTYTNRMSCSSSTTINNTNLENDTNKRHISVSGYDEPGTSSASGY